MQVKELQSLVQDCKRHLKKTFPCSNHHHHLIFASSSSSDLHHRHPHVHIIAIIIIIIVIDAIIILCMIIINIITDLIVINEYHCHCTIIVSGYTSYDQNSNSLTIITTVIIFTITIVVATNSTNNYPCRTNFL